MPERKSLSIQGQKHALEAQIQTLQATLDALAANGGKSKLNECRCGKDQRKCVKVNIGMEIGERTTRF